MAMSDGWAEDDFQETYAYQAQSEMCDAINTQARTSTATLERPAEPEYHWATDVCSYHRNAKGNWVVIGPVELCTEGLVTVRTKAGKERNENVLGTGEPFEHHGQMYCYGYIAKREYHAKRRVSYRTQEDAAKAYNRRYGA